MVHNGFMKFSILETNTYVSKKFTQYIAFTLRRSKFVNKELLTKIEIIKIFW